MAEGDIETYCDDGQWKNRREGRTRPFSRADTKEEAQALGRQAAIRDGVEHVIKKKDGTIGARNTYPRSRDPRRTAG